MRLHEVVDEVDLCPQVLDAGAHHDVHEDRKQVVHAPAMILAQLSLHRLQSKKRQVLI